MSPLTLLLLRVGFLVLLWVFIFIVIYALRSDLFGSRLTRLQQTPQPASPAPAARAAAPANPDAATTVTRMARGSSRSQPASRLVVTGGPRAGLEMDLPATGLTIGRSSGSGLQVKDDYSSSNHARITRRGDDWIVEDLGSTNGTFLAGRRVTAPVVVAPGVELRIGTTTFELRR